MGTLFFWVEVPVRKSCERGVFIGLHIESTGTVLKYSGFHEDFHETTVSMDANRRLYRVESSGLLIGLSRRVLRDCLLIYLIFI